MKVILTSLILVFLLSGCGRLLGFRGVPTLVEVKVITVKTDADYRGRVNEIYPHTVVERLDTHERIMISRCTWGQTGDVFTIQTRNLKWK